MNTQPEALRLADALDKACGNVVGTYPKNAAAELRRLHALNTELLEALKLADALLLGANMDVLVVEKKVKAAIAKATGEV